MINQEQLPRILPNFALTQRSVEDTRLDNIQTIDVSELRNSVDSKKVFISMFSMIMGISTGLLVPLIASGLTNFPENVARLNELVRLVMLYG